MFSTTVWTCLDCFCSIKQKLRSRHAAFMEVNNKDCRKQTSLLEPTPSNGHLPRAMGYIDTYACTNMHIYTQLHMHIESKWIIYSWRTKLLTTRSGLGKSGWSPIGCEGLYFFAMCKNKVSVGAWSPIGCECVRTDLKIPCPLVFR